MSRDIVDFTAKLVGRRDSDSGGHLQRVREYTDTLATAVREMFPEYGLTEEIVAEIVEASVLHDVGKIYIPDRILLKPGSLDKEEFNEIKKHTSYGETIVEDLPDSVEEPVRSFGIEMAASHHERFDGRGYPQGLVGEEIPISAQIVSVADCFDALTSDRPYKSAYSPDTAYQMILSGQCGAFSEKLLACFTQCRKQFTEIARKNEAELNRDEESYDRLDEKKHRS